jgi:hypothetical protein
MKSVKIGIVFCQMDPLSASVYLMPITKKYCPKYTCVVHHANRPCQ